MKLNRRLIMIAVLLSLLATIVVYYYQTSGQTQVEEQISYINIVTAVDTIPAYTEITEDMLQYESVPEEYVHPDTILNKDDILAGITNGDIYAGEPILKERVIVDKDAASLSYQVEENMRAISIPVTEVTGIAGYAKKGDHIDILVSYQLDTTMQDSEQTYDENGDQVTTNDSEGQDQNSSTVYTQLQNIEVMAEGPYTGTTEESTDISSFTVMVTPEQAEVLTFAMINGTMQCTLRNPADNVKSELQYYGTENFSTWRDR